MVHQRNIEGHQTKEGRGRFQKGNIRGKLPVNTPSNSGRSSSSDERGGLKNKEESVSALEGMFDKVASSLDQIAAENLNPASEEKKSPTIEDRIVFTNGNNKIELVLLRYTHRLYKLQIFLNDKTEIKPSSYIGHSMKEMCWGMLKGVLKS